MQTVVSCLWTGLRPCHIARSAVRQCGAEAFGSEFGPLSPALFRLPPAPGVTPPHTPSPRAAFTGGSGKPTPIPISPARFKNLFTVMMKFSW